MCARHCFSPVFLFFHWMLLYFCLLTVFNSCTLPSFPSSYGSFLTQMAFKAPVLRVLKKVYSVWGSLLWLRLWVKTSPRLDSLLLCLTLSAQLFFLSHSVSLCLPSLTHCAFLPLSPSLSSTKHLVLTNWSCSRSLPWACTTPQTRVETGSSRS